MTEHGRRRNSDGPALGAFWLSVVALILVLCAGLGREAGVWSFRVGWFLLQWGAYQGVFGSCFAVGVLLDDRRKSTVRWALPAVLSGLTAAGAAYLRFGFPGV